MRKGQAAMEFLMTYGWAILVVLAAIAALAYFGVLSPDRFFPDKCTIQGGGFACVESKVTRDSPANNATIEMVVRNSGGSNMQAMTVTLEDASCNIAAGGETVDVGSLENGESTSVLSWSCTDLTASKFRGKITVNYQPDEATLWQTATGSITKGITTS